MDTKFWKTKWEKGEIGFHLAEINPLLKKYFPKDLDIKRALIPLCGKTKDLLYLAKQCNKILGIECCEMALKQFFAENTLSTPKISDSNIYSSENIEIALSDIFKFDFNDFITKSLNQKFDFIYDRAATVAMPKELRAKYHKLLRKNLSKNGNILLIAFEIERDKTIGPPFSVEQEEIEKNFNGLNIEVLFRSPKEESPRFGALTSEVVYFISNK